MKVTCPSCQTTYNLDASRIPPGGAKLKCAKCQTTFPVKPGQAAPEAVALPSPDFTRASTVEMPAGMARKLIDEAVPLPASNRSVDFGFDAPSSDAVPLPGAGSEGSESEDEQATRLVNVPDDVGGAVPLPGGSDFSFGSGDEGSTGAVPLPGGESGHDDGFGADAQGYGGASDDSVPLPGGDGFGDSAETGAIPLPGAEGDAFGDPPGAVDFGGDAFGNETAGQGDAVPLPGEAGGFAASGDDFGYAPEGSDPGAVPLPGGDAAGFGSAQDDYSAAETGAVPLPGEGSDSDGGFHFPPAPEGDAVPLPGDATAGFDAPSEDFAFGSDPSGADAVPLPGEHSGGFDFPPAPAPEGDALPLPGGDGSDFGAAAHDDAFGAASEAVPLPGEAGHGASFPAASDDPFGTYDPTASAVPLPGGDDAPFPFAPPPAAGDGFGEPEAGTEAAIPLPQDLPFPGEHPEAAAAAIPLPGDSFGSDESDSDQPTRVFDASQQLGDGGFDVPFEGAASDQVTGSVDVRGQDFAGAMPFDAPAPSEPPVPLPPSPGRFDADIGFEDPTRPQGEPLPAFGEEPSSDDPTRVIPAAASAAIAPPPPPLDGDFTFDDGDPAVPVPPPNEDVGFDEPTRVAPIPKELLTGAPPPPRAIVPPPLPSAAFGTPAEEDADDFDQPTRVMSTAAIASAASAAGMDDPFAMVGASASAPPPIPAIAPPIPAIAPSAPEEEDPFAAVDLAPPPRPAAPSFSLDDLPSPAPSADPFADLPSPAPASASDDPFASMDIGAPAAPAPVDLSTDFGGVDFGGDTGSSGEDDAFGSAPAHPGEHPAVSGPEPTFGGRRFHVRRRSGKVFGPFDSVAIVKMLGDGQLVGNEDVSEDSSSWSAIGSVPAFSDAVQKAASRPKGETAPATDEALEKLKQMYGGRMATVSVVETKDYAGAVKRQLPKLGLLAGVLVVVGLGVSLALTPYGAFGIKWLIPAKVERGTPAFAEVTAAQKALLADTFDGYKDAREKTAKVLRLNEYPEVRALWCQAIFYLQRRYAAASHGEIAQANKALDEISVLGKKNPEVAKALAGAALAARQPGQAIAILKEAIARDGTSDPELALLAAEAYGDLNQPKDAMAQLERLLSRKPDSAKALHALGDLYQAAGDADKAEAEYQKALKANPGHVISAVELAAVELLVRKDLDKADAALKSALAEKTLGALGPAEIARGRALQGVLLADRFKYAEAQQSLEDALKRDPDSLFAKANLAEVLLAEHEYDKALPLFREASAREPRKLAWTDGYLSTLIATGKMSDALSVVQKVAGLFPDNARIAFLTARVNDALDHGLEAEKAYKRAIAADPKLFEANLYLGRFYLKSKRIPEAKEQLDAAAQKAPDSAAVRAGAGELRLAEGNPAEAKTEFQKAIQLEPTLSEGHLGLARADLALGQLKEAKTEVDQALSLDGHLQGGHLTAGRVDWRLGDLDGALAELAKAKAEAPTSAEVEIDIGAVKLDKGDLAGAEADLLIALSDDPVSAEANFDMARVKAAQGQFTQAQDHMKDALDRAPKNAGYHYEMGVIFRGSKNVADAITEWKKAIELDPKHVDSLEALGQVYLDQGRFDDAVAMFEQGLKADPTRHRLIGLEGDCYFQATRWKEAIAKYQQALKADPTLTALYYKVGRSFGEQGNGVEAIRWYQKATVADAKNAMPYYYLGYAYKEKGKRQDAIGAFKQYLAKKPDAPDRKDIEDEIYDLQQPQ